MEKYLPSKIFIAVAASALFIMGGGYFVFFVLGSKYQGARERKSEHQIVAQKQETALFANKDADSDGLKDWEEVLWHTDSEKSDTDGDGMGDNEEILARRDPAVAGTGKIDAPGASMGVSTAKSSQAAPSLSTLTESLAQQFGEAYMRQKFGGTGKVDGQYLSKLFFSDITKRFTEESDKPPEEHFVKEDFVVINDSSPQAIKAYLNRLGAILNSNESRPEDVFTQNELLFAAEALKEQRFDDFKKLRVAGDAYHEFANAIKVVPAPQGLARSHRDMVNSFWRLGDIVNQMSTFPEDPLGGMAAFVAYLVEARRSVEPVTAIVKEMKENNLVFDQNEGGAIFNRYLSVL
jgi:hypothetical protein